MVIFMAYSMEFNWEHRMELYWDIQLEIQLDLLDDFNMTILMLHLMETL